MAQDTECLFVGIDAHQESLSIAVLALGAERPEPTHKIANDPAKIRRVVEALQKRGSLHATYEAGCTGFVLWRQLTQLGVDCLVAAPSRIPVLPGEHRKTDRLDAERLAVFLRGGQLTAVRPPTPEQEALRTLILSCPLDLGASISERLRPHGPDRLRPQGPARVGEVDIEPPRHPPNG